jgi:thiamine biosynthesis lipoprotein
LPAAIALFVLAGVTAAVSSRDAHDLALLDSVEQGELAATPELPSRGSPVAGVSDSGVVPTARPDPAEIEPPVETEPRAQGPAEIEPAAPDPVNVAPDPAPPGFSYRHEDVLGTSFRLVVIAPSRRAADKAHKVVLDEVERFRKIFSTYDPKAELAQINALPWESRKDLRVSKYLARVLGWSLEWNEDSQGAFDPYMGRRRAGETGKAPPAADLDMHRGRRPGFSLKRVKGGKKKRSYLTCDRAGQFDLGGIAKGFIIDRALLKLRGAVDGAMLDIGGDLGVLGHAGDGRPWDIGVVDPRRNADNEPPLETLTLKNMGVASSGGYARFVEIDGERRSHILDPRSGEPAKAVFGVTVVAPTAAEADALATALCVLDPAEGIALIDRQKVAACLIVDRSGAVHRSRLWNRFKARSSRAMAATWPSDYEVSLSFTLVNSWKTVNRQRGKRRKFKRHGTAVWIEDAQGYRVRLLALWFDRDEMGYVRDLDDFWRDGWVLSGGGADYRPLRTVSRASRPVGRYSLVWDGRDEQGQAVPQGKYRVRIDINREHGPPRGRERHTVASVEIDCGEQRAHGVVKDQPELAEVSVTYGRRAE